MTTKQISKTPTSDYINESSKEYSIYVAQSRAIPNVSDGLKDSQRKALWVMKNKNEKIKTISLAGEMISSGLFLHGDASAAMTASMLAAPFVNNIPLLHGIGAFGTRVAPVEGIGAARYTYLKKSSVTEALVYRDLDIVPLKPNYDGSNMEPQHFLPLVPLVLLNGTMGLAVGWSTSILPRNLKKIITATQAVLDGKEPKGLEPHYDYVNVSVENLEPNVWEFKGRAVIVDSSSIRVTELPPGLNLENFKKRLNKMEEDDLIQTYTDRSTEGIDILVKLKRGQCKDWVEADAVNYFKIRERTTERIVVLDWNGKSIRQFESPEQVMKEFVQWRLGWYTTRYDKMLADDEYELKYWKGLKACFDNKFPELIIGKFDKDAIMQVVNDLTSTIGLDSAQVDKIVSLPTYRWATDFFKTVKENIASLTSSVKEYKAILKSPTKLKEIYHSELEELKKIK